MAHARDVAAALRGLDRGAGVVKVHKLLYYCQAWHAVWTGEPLFDEEVEAWANGPVVADFWREEKHGYASPPGPLGTDEMRTVKYVYARYGHRWGNELIGDTHAEAPWLNARAMGLNTEIGVGDMVEFFKNDEAADQAWFWDPEWLDGEKAADEDIREGRVSAAMTADEFLRSIL